MLQSMVQVQKIHAAMRGHKNSENKKSPEVFGQAKKPPEVVGSFK
jgi:hypothetical protein